MAMMLEQPSSSMTRDIFGQSWEGRRVTVVGLGRSGMAAIRLLSKLGCRIRVTEARETEQLRALREALITEGIDDVELGGHSQRFVDETDVVIVSPGVPERSGPIPWALERQIPIISEIELAFHCCPSPIVAVTGTNGKSSTVTLIADVLRACGRPAMACGNLGIPFSSIVEQLTAQTIAVVEVSSFQLLWCHQFRPKVAVVLNVGTNHLDRHDNVETYIAAKRRIVQRQTPEDWAILNGRDPSVVAMSAACQSRQIWFGENRSNGEQFVLAPQTLEMFAENAQAVLQVSRVLDVPDPLTWQVIRFFRGLEHRLEYVATHVGVQFINDSKSTTPDSLLYALRQTQGDLVVILGGRNKGLEFSSLVAPLSEARVKGIVLIGESRAQLRDMLRECMTVRESTSLEDAVQTATSLATAGTTVLFSPACASFDMFKNFEDRGRVFKAIVQQLSTNGHANGRPH